VQALAFKKAYAPPGSTNGRHGHHHNDSNVQTTMIGDRVVLLSVANTIKHTHKDNTGNNNNNGEFPASVACMY
jgi:hypothetical protein